jgi:hypothetical protein
MWSCRALDARPPSFRSSFTPLVRIGEAVAQQTQLRSLPPCAEGTLKQRTERISLKFEV